MVAVARNVLEGEGFGYSLPSRGANDQVYLEQLDRIVLKDKHTFTSFSSTGSVRKVAILTRVMQLVHGVLSRGIHVTKRDLFYTDVKLFKDQKDSDAVLDDVSCLLGCTRNSLHVVASEKGVVVGRERERGEGYIGRTRGTRGGGGGLGVAAFAHSSFMRPHLSRCLSSPLISSRLLSTPLDPFHARRAGYPRRRQAAVRGGRGRDRLHQDGHRR